MTPRNYLYLLNKYDEYRVHIERLLHSIVTTLSPERVIASDEQRQEVITKLHQSYPFVELVYCLDSNGKQITESAAAPGISIHKRQEAGLGSDRGHRPYFVSAQQEASAITVTAPYLSSATHQLALSSTQRYTNPEGEICYLVINVNVEKLITFLNGDELRRKVHPLFQIAYGVIGVMLVLVAGLLVFTAGISLVEVIMEHTNTATQAFGIVILITLGLAIFDLGKTILEEEVLMHKDVHHQGSTRRTISRFMSAIVIAVSIESLLLMFKSLLGDATHLNSAVAMLCAAVALLVGLGVYLKLTQEKS